MEYLGWTRSEMEKCERDGPGQRISCVWAFSVHPARGFIIIRRIEWRWVNPTILDSPSPWSLLRMKTDGNSGETPSIISVFVFYYMKWERERKWDIQVMKEGENWKIYQSILFNYHSLCMNTTLDTLLHKLFLKKYDQNFLFSTIKTLKYTYWWWGT